MRREEFEVQTHAGGGGVGLDQSQRLPRPPLLLLKVL